MVVFDGFNREMSTLRSPGHSELEGIHKEIRKEFLKAAEFSADRSLREEINQIQVD
jgi:hypothetical protein